MYTPLRGLSTCAYVDTHEEDIEFESDAQFPDPQAAKTLLTNGVTSISNVEVATGALIESAEVIRTVRERLKGVN